MTNTPKNWVRRTLLSGVALGAMATGAQADELSELKAQLEALQSRVNSIESTGPAVSSAAPEGASYISFRRGSDVYKVDGPKRGGEEYNDDRGFTIAITPTADLPAPVVEVSVSGYVKGDFIYDTRSDQGRSASPGNITIGGGDDPNFQAHAQQSRFRIKSKSDTAVGQIRTLIEGDFEGGDGANFRLRHAWGEWDVTPDLTFGMGQTWSTHYHFAGEIPTVDFSGLVGTSGFNASRVAQIQIKSSTRSGFLGHRPPGSALSDGWRQLTTTSFRIWLPRPTSSWLVLRSVMSGIVREIHVDGSANGTGGGV